MVVRLLWRREGRVVTTTTMVMIQKRASDADVVLISTSCHGA